MAEMKFVPIYRSMYETIMDENLSPEEFKRAIYPYLRYGFEGIPLDEKEEPDRFFRSIYKQNVPFIDKYRADIENGKKGGRPSKKPPKTPVKPDKEKESETETDKETENDITSSVSPPLSGGVSTSNDDGEAFDCGSILERSKNGNAQIS